MLIFEQRWNGLCALTGCAISEILRACHIKPWKKSSNPERLNPANGFLLIAHVDALFDGGRRNDACIGEYRRSASAIQSARQIALRTDERGKAIPRVSSPLHFRLKRRRFPAWAHGVDPAMLWKLAAGHNHDHTVDTTKAAAPFILGIGHVVLRAANSAELERFYLDVLVHIAG